MFTYETTVTTRFGDGLAIERPMRITYELERAVGGGSQPKYLKTEVMVAREWVPCAWLWDISAVGQDIELDEALVRNAAERA